MKRYPELYSCDPTFYSKFRLESCRTPRQLILRIARGYFDPFRAVRARAFRMAEKVSNEPWRLEARFCVNELLSHEVLIHPFINHPLRYNQRLPYYHAVVLEVMYLRKAVLRLELCDTDGNDFTFTNDMRTMFQNIYDYTQLVNPSNRNLSQTAVWLYENVVVPYYRRTLPPSLRSDGKTERTRRTGECLQTLCAIEDRKRAHLLSMVRQKKEAELIGIYRRRSSASSSLSSNERLKRYREKTAVIRRNCLKRAMLEVDNEEEEE